MIPHQNSEVLANGLKGRVTACRKRLRVNRGVHRVHLNIESPTLGMDTTAVLLNEHPANREFVCREDDSQLSDRKAAGRLEHEVAQT